MIEWSKKPSHTTVPLSGRVEPRFLNMFDVERSSWLGPGVPHPDPAHAHRHTLENLLWKENPAQYFARYLCHRNFVRRFLTLQ